MQDSKFDSETLRVKAADNIRRMIIEGELKPREKISERRLSKALSISTTPVKEAFRILQTEGLIYSVPRKGSYVSDSYKKNVLQLVFMRGALEGTAAYFACMEATAEDISEMEQALARAKQYVDGTLPNQGTELAACNDAFHNALRRSAKNRYLVQMIQNLGSVDGIIRSVANRTIGEESSRAYQEHCAILSAIKNGKSVEAESLMVSHIRRVALYVLEHGDFPSS